MTGDHGSDSESRASGGNEPDRTPTPMRGVWVAVVIVAGAALVFLLLALTSGALTF